MKRCAIRSVIVGLAALLGLLACGPQEVRSQEAAKPAVDDFKIESRHVDIWSDGTRLSGDLWHPKDLQPGDKLPAVILCHGWGRGCVHTLTRLMHRSLQRQVMWYCPSTIAAGATATVVWLSKRRCPNMRFFPEPTLRSMAKAACNQSRWPLSGLISIFEKKEQV